MAKPYREGKGWAVRVRVDGNDDYLGGFPTAAAAQKAHDERRATLAKAGKPARLGLRRTLLGVAFQDYARERLPFLKGAAQDARRINLLEGISPEAISRLQDKQFTPDVTRVLRNMKAARQVEAVS